MFGQLLESRARRARRTGGAALSVAVHTAIIGAAVALTAQRGTPAPRIPEVTVAVHFAPPVAPDLPRTPMMHVPLNLRGPSFTKRTIDVPLVTAPALPAIDPTAGLSFALGMISIGPSGPGHPVSGTIGVLVEEPPRSGAWTGKELLMRIVSSAKPRYPESLRQAGIGGRVLVRFTVDTLGRIDMGTVQVLESTHDLFSRSVRDALALFRFKPSEVGGHRVRSLAEMPFEFQVTR